MPIDYLTLKTGLQNTLKAEAVPCTKSQQLQLMHKPSSLLELTQVLQSA
jgi:hypothetical protein